MINTELYDIARKLKRGDIIQFRELVKNPPSDKVMSAKVIAVEIDESRPQVNFTYVPCDLPDTVRCGFGCHFIAPEPNNSHKKGEWGWQSLEIVGFVNL